MNFSSKFILPLILLISISIQQIVYSQEERGGFDKFLDGSTVWAELGGHGFAYSLAFEKILFGKKNPFTAQVGFAYYPVKSGIIPLWVPITINQMIPIHSDKHYLEFGLGLMLNDDGREDLNGNHTSDYRMDDIVARLGYRFRSPVNRNEIRISFTPIFQDLNNNLPRNISNMGQWVSDNMIPWAAIGIGFRF